MIKFLVNKFVPVLCFAILIVFLGINAYNTIPREANPEIKQAIIIVSTTYAGVAAKDIESLITEKIENEVDGLDGLQKITSDSYQSFSQVVMEFSDDITVDQALRKVKDRVDTVKSDLPEDADEPVVKEFSMQDWAPTFTFVLSHPAGVMVLDNFAKELQDRLNKVEGVLDTEMYGDQTWEIGVDLDPVKLEHYGFTIEDAQYAIMGEHTTIPGGVLKNSKKSYSLSVTGEIKDPNQFGEIIVQSGGKKIKLKDIADVSFRPEEPSSYARINGNAAITMNIKKKVGSNVPKLVEDAKKVIDDYMYKMPAGGSVEITLDSSEQIDTMIADLENNMFTSIVLVLLVTFLFLGKTNSIFVSIAIPFSMLISFFVLKMMGLTLNTMVLFSLILALGMLVDNGIVIVENIFRHASMGKSRKQAAIDGTKEVAGAIIASTMTTCLVFFPILLMPGIMGSFMSFIPKTVIVVLLASLGVGLSLTPVFCSRFLRMTEKAKKKMVEGGGFFGKLQDRYYKILNYSMHRAKRFIWISIGVCFLGMIMYGAVGKDPIFFVDTDPSSISVSIDAPSGTSIDETDKFVRRVEEIIPNSPASLKSFTSRTSSDGSGYISVNYKTYNEREIKTETAQVALTERLKDITGAKVVVESYSGMGGNDISYRVVGDDYAQLGEISDKLLAVMNQYQEVKISDTDYEASEPEFVIDVNREKAAFYGLNTRQVASIIRTAINGSSVGKYRVGEDEYDINVRYKKDSRDSIDNLKNLQLTVEGKRIALGSIADIRESQTIGVIKREELKRTVNVFANLKKGIPNAATVIAEVDQQVMEIKESLPPGYDILLGADGEMQSDVTSFLGKAFLVALFLIFILLIGQFNSIADPFISLFASFLAVGGVFWGFTLTGMSFGILMSGIGCISLIGVAVNNCIVLVDYTNLLIKDGMNWRMAIPEAGKTRLKPVILTALTTVLALVPMGLGFSFDLGTFRMMWDSETAAMWQPFAWAMIFGLSFSTFLTLIIVPTMLSVKHSVLENFKNRRDKKSLDSEKVVEDIEEEEDDFVFAKKDA